MTKKKDIQPSVEQEQINGEVFPTIPNTEEVEETFEEVTEETQEEEKVNPEEGLVSESHYTSSVQKVLDDILTVLFNGEVKEITINCTHKFFEKIKSKISEEVSCDSSTNTYTFSNDSILKFNIID